MGWETAKLARTLLLVRNTIGGQVRYSIHPFMRVTTPTGQTYLEPVPSQNFVGGSADVLSFDAVDYLDAPAIRRDADAGDIHLTSTSPGAAVRVGA